MKPLSRRFLVGLSLLLTMLILMPVIYIWAVFQWSYSDGERAGYIQKFSRKGWICKTWEGEIAMVVVPGTRSDKFEFTVRDDSVAEQINRTIGKRVVLVYEQHRGLPTSCFGDTEYFVTQVKVLE
ncbi:MAG: hypothetical protein ACK53K_01775 [Burkholderiales bacterium]|jgi:hypothetical protein